LPILARFYFLAIGRAIEKFNLDSYIEDFNFKGLLY
jgi:hypothetical protein